MSEATIDRARDGQGMKRRPYEKPTFVLAGQIPERLALPFEPASARPCPDCDGHGQHGDVWPDIVLCDTCEGVGEL